MLALTKERVIQMKLKIDNGSISTLFSLVQNINEIKATISNQEMTLVQLDETLKEFRDEQNAVAVEIDRRVALLHEGSMDGLKELLHLQWLQQQAAKNVAEAEMKKAGVETALSLLDDELVAYQKQVDAVMQGHKV